jgi:CheY-like chemotaxis protein
MRLPSMPNPTDIQDGHSPDRPPQARPGTRALAALGAEASGVAHDFDNALTAIVAHATLLRVSSDETTRHHAEAILRAARVGSQVVERVRRSLRPTPLASPRNRINLDDLITEALSVAETRAASRDITITSDLAPAVIAGDPAELQQAILNVVHNAIDAARTRVHLAVTTTDTTASLVINDDGRGIAPDIADDLFTPFHTTKADGTGLGLALARQITLDHGGTLALAASNASGTRFAFTFPTAIHPDLAPARPLTDFTLPGLDHALTALVVDDEAHTREALTELLEMAGFTVTACASAPEALGAVTAPNAHFHVVITDLSLGPSRAEPAGLGLIMRLAALHPGLPILVASGLPASQRPARIMRHVSMFFEKPVSPSRIIEAATTLAESRRALETEPHE